MRIDVITLFPEFFEGPLKTGLIGKTLEEGRAEVAYVDPRTFTQDRHRTVDDAPYGGGAGMLMKPEPLAQAIRCARARGPGPVVLMSPQGRRPTQADLQRWSSAEHLILVAGRYEGYDERVRDLVDDEVTLGDFVLTGGEYGALTLIDGVLRLLPGTLGNADSSAGDSFSEGLLEHPHFTRPASFEGQPVPEVLRGGDHAKIEAWRRAQSLRRTRARRPDLLTRVGLSPEDRQALWSDSVERPAALTLAVQCRPDPQALADLADLAVSYGVDRVYAVAARGEQAELQVALEAAPQRSYATPLPPPKRRKPAHPRIERRPGDLIEVLPSFDALTGDPKNHVVATTRFCGVQGSVLDPVALRQPAPDGARWVLAVGPELVSAKGIRSNGVQAVLAPLRVGTRHAGFSQVLLAAIHLDRVFGEA